MATKTTLRGRPAIMLHIDGGDDFGVDQVTPLRYTYGVVSSVSRDGTVIRAIVDAGGRHHPVISRTRTYTLPRDIYPCGLLASIRAGELLGTGLATVVRVKEITRGVIHLASHRVMCARHDLQDGCECDTRGWR